MYHMLAFLFSHSLHHNGGLKLTDDLSWISVTFWSISLFLKNGFHFSRLLKLIFLTKQIFINIENINNIIISSGLSRFTLFIPLFYSITMNINHKGGLKLNKIEKKFLRKQSKARHVLLKHEGIQAVSYPTQVTLKYYHLNIAVSTF